MIKETVYVGKDNKNELELKADGALINISNSTRVDLEFPDGELSTITSSTSGTLFDWTTRGAQGRLILDLGSESFTAGRRYEVRLVIFDSANTNGIVWGNFTIYAT